MIISANENGWAYDGSIGNWKLVYADQTVVICEQTDQPIATQITLFIGSEQECEEKIELCGLIKPIIAEPILADDFAGNEETNLVIHPADFL